MLPVFCVYLTQSVEKRTMYHWTGDMMEERQCAYKSMKEFQGRRVRLKAPDVQAIDTEYLGLVFGLVF